jgi:hypothetical protein
MSAVALLLSFRPGAQRQKTNRRRRYEAPLVESISCRRAAPIKKLTCGGVVKRHLRDLFCAARSANEN